MAAGSARCCSGSSRDFRFAVLQAPIVNVSHAIWESAAARHIRAELARCGITSALVERHEHLTFPTRVQPACGADRVVLAAGVWDQIARADDIAALHRGWSGSTLISRRAGPFRLPHGRSLFRATSPSAISTRPIHPPLPHGMNPVLRHRSAKCLRSRPELVFTFQSNVISRSWPLG